MTVLAADGVAFEVEVPVVVIGAGAAGLVAGLAAREAGAEVLLVERDPVPRGSTALSAGLIPAAGTRWQQAAGVADDPELFARDILAKAAHEPDPRAVATVTLTAAPVLEWLAERHGLVFSLVTDFRYPGHSALRMHGLASRTGAELVDRLRSAAEAAGAEIMTEAAATKLFVGADGAIAGIAVARPGGAEERIGCGALILACNGYGADRALVARHIPELADALYFGHPGNRGDAVRWGEALGLALRDLSGHQGHGSVAHPHGILITWATIMEGGCQVNRLGRRFSDESCGYSEQAALVLAQPDGVAFNVFDARIAAIARQFEDFRTAEAAGAVLEAATVEKLASRLDVPAATFAATLAELEAGKAAGGRDRFGRALARVPPLAPPYRAVKVTGALFHTQGGIVVDERARALRPCGRPMPNLFAAGGAAVGVSGRTAAGYLSGNGLLTALAYGWLAGRAAAAAGGG